MKIFYLSTMLFCLALLPFAANADPWNTETKHGDPTHKHIAREAAEVWPSVNEPGHELWTYLENGTNVGDYYDGDDIVEGSWEQDYPNADMRWMEHFWDADNSSNPYNYGYDLPSVHDSAYTAALEYWDDALAEYDNDRALSYYYLGNVAHYLSDMSVPEHAKLHAHASAYTYEKYVNERYGNWTTTSPVNVEGDPVYATALDCLPADETQPLIFRLFYHLNQQADAEACIGDWMLISEKCYSGDAYDRMGTYHPEWEGARPSCDLSSSDFNAQANRLMPITFQYIGGLYALFWDQLHDPEILSTSLQDEMILANDVSVVVEIYNEGGEPGISTVTYSVDGGAAVDVPYSYATDGSVFAATWDTSGLVPGSTHTVIITATDVFGNESQITYSDVKAGDCIINDVGYADGDPNPDNECEICDDDQSTTDWTANVGASCDDGLYCTVTDLCNASGACVGATRDCLDLGDQCNWGECDESGDTCYASPKTGGTPCDDGLFCNGDDFCDGSGNCLFTSRDCSVVGDQCNWGECDEDGDTCYASPKPTGLGCDDDLYCTVSDQCNAVGTCVGATRDCSGAGDQCNWGECDEDGDTCYASPKANGTSCDDDEFCTVDDTCQGGTCSSTNPRDCSDSAFCNGTESCDEAGDQCVSSGDPCIGSGMICNEAGDICEDDETAIELISFNASEVSGYVRLEWATALEPGNAGFHLWRADDPDSGFGLITPSLIASRGSETHGASYSWTDEDVEPGSSYFYKLESISVNGESFFHGPVSVTLPEESFFGCGSL